MAKDRIARSAGIIALGNVTSRLLGLVRDQITAGLFGRSGGTDAFFVASNISQVFYDLLIQGAVSSALVPVFASYAGEKERARLWRLASLVINMAIIILAIVVLILVIAAPLVVRLAGPGFGPDLQQLATGLTRLTLLAVVFLGSSAVLTALLYSLQDFVFPAFCSALFNGCIILMAVLFHNQLGVGSLALGMLIGAIAPGAVPTPAAHPPAHALCLRHRSARPRPAPHSVALCPGGGRFCRLRHTGVYRPQPRLAHA